MVMNIERVAGRYTGARVFCATRAEDRANLGERVTVWLRENPGVEIADVCVTQSSDADFHCLTITLFFRGARSRRAL